MKVAVVMGSDSDLKVMEPAIRCLREFKVEVHFQVLSAHRTPHDMIEFADRVSNEKIDIIIAGAGGAAHLPGMLASCCDIPVIGVPVRLSVLDGMDSLLSIAQMPKGVPVATVAIDNSLNAALLAIRILSISNAELKSKHHDYRMEMARASRGKTLDC